MIEVFGLAATYDAVHEVAFAADVRGKRSGETFRSLFRRGALWAERQLPLLLDHDERRRVGTVTSVWQTPAGLAMRAMVDPNVLPRSHWLRPELSVRYDSQRASTEWSDGAGEGVLEVVDAPLREISIVRSGCCGPRARITTWRPLVMSYGQRAVKW